METNEIDIATEDILHVGQNETKTNIPGLVERSTTTEANEYTLINMVSLLSQHANTVPEQEGTRNRPMRRCIIGQ